MHVRPYFITAILTVAVIAVAAGVYRQHLLDADATARARIVEGVIALAPELRAAADEPTQDRFAPVMARTHALDAVFASRAASPLARRTGLTAAIAHTIADAPDEHDGLFQRAYLLTDAADRAVRTRSLFATATVGIAAYRADVDLQGLTPATDGREIVYRMYLAKGGLQKARVMLTQAAASVADSRPLTDIITAADDLLSTIDRVIISTNGGAEEDASAQLSEYRTRMGRLQRLVAAYATSLAGDTTLDRLARDIGAVAVRFGTLR